MTRFGAESLASKGLAHLLEHPMLKNNNFDEVFLSEDSADAIQTQVWLSGGCGG